MNPESNAPAALRGVVRGLNHVAIVVPSIASARGAYESALGLSAGEVEYIPDHLVNVLVLHAGGQRIELVEPAVPDSPVTRFLERTGGGMHHLAWDVDDVDAAIARLEAQGVKMIDRVAKGGAHGARVAFVHPKSTGGVLMELVEVAKDVRGHR